MRGLYTQAVPPSLDAEPATPPDRTLGPYIRVAARIHPPDPRASLVAERVIALIRERRPDLVVEHIGSTAVPGIPGKGIVDLGTEADPADISAITAAMYEIGFGPQGGPDPWPPTRPMHVATYWLDGVAFPIHFHVHPRGGDLAKDLAFRDGLRADPDLAAGYAATKVRLAEEAGEGFDWTGYQQGKGGWILDAYDRLGIERPDDPTTAAERRPTESDDPNRKEETTA